MFAGNEADVVVGVDGGGGDGTLGKNGRLSGGDAVLGVNGTSGGDGGDGGEFCGKNGWWRVRRLCAVVDSPEIVMENVTMKMIMMSILIE